MPVLRSVNDSLGEALPHTMTVAAAAALLGISRSTAYVEAARYRTSEGECGIPNRCFGTRIVVLTAPLLEMLHVDQTWAVADGKGGGQPRTVAARRADGSMTHRADRAAVRRIRLARAER